MTESFVVETRESAFNLRARVVFMGSDLLVAVWGGDKPHVGAVTVSESHPSLKDPARKDATASTVCLLGHKEEALTRPIAEKLSRALAVNVVVVAGAHFDVIDKAGIEQVVDHGGILADLILERLSAV